MAQGHWRRLKQGQVGEGRFGEETYGKTWVDTKDTVKAQKAKKIGKVPPPVVVKIDKEAGFAVLGVPGGNFLFAVHISVLNNFAEAVSKADNWTTDSKVRKIMQKAEKEGKFGIFRTQDQVAEY